jgi:hypothetical protein
MKIQMKNTIHFAHLNVHLLLMNIFDYRQRNGEKLTPEAYLIRNEFDSYAPLSLRQSVRGITKKTIAETIRLLMKKEGLTTLAIFL